MGVMIDDSSSQVSLHLKHKPRFKTEGEIDATKPLKTSGKVGKEEWNCISISYPLEKVIKGFAIFDMLRAIIDTAVIISILVFVIGLKFDEVSLSKAISTETELSTRKQTELKYRSNKNFLVYALGTGAFFFFAEVPLSIYLLYALRTTVNKKLNLNRYIQYSIGAIVLNLLVSIVIVIFLAKVGIIRNDNLISGRKTYLRSVSYCFVFRIAFYDLTKGAELVCINVFMQENKRRVTWGVDLIGPAND